jgi:mRNA-degrading endonuclease RelE of RelBE toxin-antitoxin system
MLVMVFIETTIFTKLLHGYLTEDEYFALQDFLLQHPESGDLVPGSGGVRKIRWGLANKGKRGGVRVIYYWKKQADQIWMLTIYSKNEISNIPGHVLKRIAEEIKNA